MGQELGVHGRDRGNPVTSQAVFLDEKSSRLRWKAKRAKERSFPDRDGHGWMDTFLQALAVRQREAPTMRSDFPQTLPGDT